MEKLNDFKEKVFTFTQKFASKTGDYAHITKLMMEIKSLETKLDSAAEKLGKTVYELVQKNVSFDKNDSAIAPFLEKITSYSTQIEEKKREIDQIKVADKDEDPEKSDVTDQTNKD